MDALAVYGMVELLFFVVKVWAVVVWLRLPTFAWSESGHSRGTWLVLLVVGVFLPVIGFGLALWFLFSTSTDVARMAQLGRRPGFPRS
jgi:uncharacterized membrane protein YozB (DUF420 family)